MWDLRLRAPVAIVEPVSPSPTLASRLFRSASMAISRSQEFEMNSATESSRLGLLTVLFISLGSLRRFNLLGVRAEGQAVGATGAVSAEIGRASCRERV